jgi:hypothetical protein
MKTLENTLSPRTSPLNHTRQTAAWSIQTAFAMLFAVLFLSGVSTQAQSLVWQGM